MSARAPDPEPGPAGRLDLQGLRGGGDRGRLEVRVGVREHGQLGGGQGHDLDIGRVVQAGHALDEVGQHLGAQPPLAEAGQQFPGPFAGVRRPAAADVLHGVEDDARRDAAPDAVPDAQLALHHEVHDVVRQPGPGLAAVQPVHGSVVALYQGVGALVVREPGKPHAHIPTMRTGRTGRLMVFLCRMVAVRGGPRDDGDGGAGAGEDPVHRARIRA
jgi:hypothetical protein